MKKRHFLFTSTLALSVCTTAGLAQVWAPGITIDGGVAEWDGQVPALITDVEGNGGDGRDIKAIYLANDATYLYVRIESYNAVEYNGQEFSGIDGDNSDTTGFNLFGLGIGSDTLIAGASVFGETTGSFNSGAATPGAVSWGPSAVASTNIEYAIELGTTIPGDISASFPGGLGSTISFIYGDDNANATALVGPAEYTLAEAPASNPAPDFIDEMDAFDTNENALNRLTDISATGFSAVAGNFAAGGPGGAGDTALEVIHTTDDVPWSISGVNRRFIAPIDISDHTGVTLDFFGDPALTTQNLFIQLRDLDGSRWAIGVGISDGGYNVDEWNTVELGSPADWFEQGGSGALDLENIIGYDLIIQESGTAAAGTFTVGYDNFAVVKEGSSVNDWQMLH